MSRATEEGQYNSKGGKIAIKWCSPEVLDHHQFSRASDVWAFGCTLWELFTNGQDPYPNFSTQEIGDKVVQGYRSEPPTDCPEDVRCRLDEMLIGT